MRFFNVYKDIEFLRLELLSRSSIAILGRPSVGKTELLLNLIFTADVQAYVFSGTEPLSNLEWKSEVIRRCIGRGRRPWFFFDLEKMYRRIRKDPRRMKNTVVLVLESCLREAEFYRNWMILVNMSYLAKTYGFTVIVSNACTLVEVQGNETSFMRALGSWAEEMLIMEKSIYNDKGLNEKEARLFRKIGDRRVESYLLSSETYKVEFIMTEDR